MNTTGDWILYFEKFQKDLKFLKILGNVLLSIIPERFWNYWWRSEILSYNVFYNFEIKNLISFKIHRNRPDQNDGTYLTRQVQ